MAKPTQQWETRLHRAIRQADKPAGSLADDPRAEGFTLEFVAGPNQGRTGAVACGLRVQRADALATSDPDLVHAVSAWLIARGARAIDLRGPDDEVLARGPIQPGDLGVGPEFTSTGALISICPSNAEALAALGCFDRVIACEDSSDYPPEVAQLERLGPDLGPDLDRIAALNPSLVVSSLTVPGMERNVTGLRARGIPQLVLAPRSIADVLAELERLGRALGVEARAAEQVADMREQIAALRQTKGSTWPDQTSGAGQPPVRVYLEWWPRPMFSPGADCYSNELIALAGGVNVFGERPGSSVEIDAGQLLAAEPEIAFISWCGVAAAKLDVRRLIERPGLESLAVAQAGRVFPLDEQFAGRPGPRMLEAARIMAEQIARARAEIDLCREQR
jgi:ABC-type Fe3+-hydroxamate transport system substrate-binding protein